MNQIRKHPLSTLGYNFIPNPYLPEGEDEYYLRNKQNRSGTNYRKLSAREIEILVRNRNQSDDWNKILVADLFDPELVKNCKFFGLVRIGKLEACFLEYHNLRMAVGLYNSTIISCDLGDNVVVDNVNYLSHYILGNEVVLVNVNEMSTTNYAKFGNGILKEGEDSSVRIWLEVCNENGGRKIVPFSGMLPGDAWIWSRFRTDREFQERLIEFTQNGFDSKRGYYGKVGDRSIIKNCLIIKDVWVGSDAYIKGANKLKNLTIHSSETATSQVGEGCELVNGIISEGCRIFYGVKAVRFVMASHSQLKYGARLINSYLGNNSTISCCEVLNSLIFPAHEQHHNNSFLCAALVLGQSNMAAGATVGSNHNSRGADGEIIAGRGFWPGLCVSLKHNSKFASFNIVAKGEYPAELNIKLPFSLVSNQLHTNRLIVMPAYWMMYNMYALARNSWKYEDRDRRSEKTQHLEYAYLAPDSIQEVFDGLEILEEATGNAFLSLNHPNGDFSSEECREKGAYLLIRKDPILINMDYFVEGWENSKRQVQLIKVPQAWGIYRDLLALYAVETTMNFFDNAPFPEFEEIGQLIPEEHIQWDWQNVGGQLLPGRVQEKLVIAIKEGGIKGWDQVHQFYSDQQEKYPFWKARHAFDVLLLSLGKSKGSFSKNDWLEVLNQAANTRSYLSEQVYLSRKKDYDNPFRNLVYDSLEERDLIVGAFEDNSFIKQDKADTDAFLAKIQKWKTH
ncbi:DUF4954 family protein [Pleomorphovibrio marinus]|uniref:DUF4954 family protein n=1 Tax=Pleomorphovibrio marinus TaxID=2164132 RepID=UPI000E09FC1B|nr:DUF4954 family protein [Pleomorphovibrio marinus]